MINPSTHVLLLNKAFFDLVQAARQWWKKFKESMAGCNYYPSEDKPCLFMKKLEGDEPISFIIIFVDDRGIIGTPEAIKDVIEALGKEFKDKTMSEMENLHLCHIIDTPDKDGVWIHQSKLLKNLKANFNKILGITTRI
jgi:Reverse transcriptase (RNA-dependent DNA polymerase)